MKKNTIDIFWSRVDKSGDCWIWTGMSWFDSGRERGQFNFNGKVVRTHRFAWEIHFGDIPKGMCVCHKCDNPMCVNPEHLFLATHEENNNDKVEKHRQSKGEYARHKLTEKDVKDIRGIYSCGDMTQTELAKDFGVSSRQINGIVRRGSWKHI